MLAVTCSTRALFAAAMVSASHVCEGLIRIPLHHHNQNRDNSLAHFGHSHDAQWSTLLTPQVPLQDAGDAQRAGSRHQPLKDIAIVLVGFNVSIGEPPQSVPMAFSIETDYTMVQSASCSDSLCWGHDGFNASLSDTYNETTEDFDEMFGLVRWRGQVASDTIDFAGLRLPDSRLLYGKEIQYIGYFSWYGEYDGVLGLSPQSDAWEALTASGQLDQKVVSIKFPTGSIDFQHPEARTPGELTLGGVHPDFKDGPFLDLPLTDSAGDVWATSVHSFTSDSGEEGKLPLPSKAAFLSASPFVSLPEAWVDALIEPIRKHMLGFYLGQPVFPCELRDNLTRISMVLGDGDFKQNITLSAYEYSVEVSSKEADASACIFAVGPSWSDDTIALGWPFLRMFVTVLDGEENRIRLIPKGPDA